MSQKDQDLKRFNTFITRLEDGALNEELGDKVRECVQEIADACLDRGGKHKSTLTLKLEFEMDHKNKVVEITAAVDQKLPKAPRGRGGMYFCDADGNLVRENPRQMTLEDELERKRLRDAERAGGE